MLQIEANGNNGDFLLSLPTNLSEITNDYLIKTTAHINIADNYCLIGICYRESLSSILFAGKQKKQNTITTAIVPIFVKCGKSTNDFINSLTTGDKIVIAPSVLALGNHVTSTTNKLSINTILKCTDGDKDVYTKSLEFKDKPCYFLEYKLVGASDIIGVYKQEESFNDPYIAKLDNAMEG